MKKRWRKCPRCDADISYTNYSNYRRAIRKDSVCKKCSVNRGKYTEGEDPWNKGLTGFGPPTNSFPKGHTAWNRKSDDEILCENSKAGRVAVRIRMQEQVEYECVKCENPGEWMNEALTLHLDHINGVNDDHRIENLRWLCPNCHQQTPTWGRQVTEE